MRLRVGGYSKLRGALVDEFYDERTLSLGESGAVPEDATVVVIFGPTSDFLPFELEALEAYVRRGGALFVLLDPDSSPSFVTFLERYGIHLPPLIAVDPTKRLYAGEMLTFRASATSKPHPMIRSVNAPPIFFTRPRRGDGAGPGKGPDCDRYPGDLTPRLGQCAGKHPAQWGDDL